MAKPLQDDARVYGPVPSRRYGLSLGVDLVPRKACCYDCVYCQVGPTTALSVERREFFPVEAILEEVARALERGPRPEVITLAGSGEPSLHAGLGRVIQGLKRLADIPVLLLTNGGLLWREDVLGDALLADILSPSLDAPDAAVFLAINRPHPDITFERMRAGVRAACTRHPGSVRLEVMLAAGLNDDEACLEAFARQLSSLRAEVIDLNTPVRPSPGRGVPACTQERLLRAQALFGPRCLLVGEFAGRAGQAMPDGEVERLVYALLARRPCTLSDLAVCLGLARERLDALVARGLAEGRLAREERAQGVYFFVSP